MKDPIEREDAIRVINETSFLRRPILKHYIKAKIERIPSAEPKQGEWAATGNTDEWYGLVYKCSICGSEVICDCDNYCPNCGARMKGADNEDDQSMDPRNGSGR